MDNIFVIQVDDVQRIAGKKIGRELTIEELEQVQKGVEFGLELSWMEIIEDAIHFDKYTDPIKFYMQQLEWFVQQS